MKMEKNLYEVILNWHGTPHKFWTHANSKDKAFLNAITRLSKLTGFSFHATMNYYLTQAKDNYSIKKEVRKE